MSWSVTPDSMTWRRVGRWLGGRILSLAVNPDGRTVIATVEGEGLRWWRPDSEDAGVLRPSGTPDSVVYGRDGRIIYGSAEGHVACWSEHDLVQSNHSPSWEFSEPPASAPAWGFPDREPAARRLLRICGKGGLVVSPRYRRMVVLAVEDGSTVAVFEPPARPTSIAVDPETSLVVIGGLDGSLTWWDAAVLRTGCEYSPRYRANRAPASS